MYRRFAALLLLAACSAEPAAPSPDAEASDAPDAAPCGGTCGAGTVCELGRCVAVIGPDASPDATAEAGADAAGPDAPPDAPEATSGDAAPESSVPVCPAGLVLCGAACVDTATDFANCGACGQRCSGNPERHQPNACEAGRCVARCELNWGDCDMNLGTNGCEGSLTRVTNCGRCGVDCGRNGACVPSDGGYACR